MTNSNNENSKFQISSFRCPECENEDAKMITHVLDIPYYDDFMMITITCDRCKLRVNDFFNLNSKGHTKYEYQVTQEGDGTTKVVRAKDGIISIPELELIIEPTSNASTWIRNLEGILLDIEEKLKIAKDDLKDDEEDQIIKIEEKLKLLDKLKFYKIPYTIIVEDITGNSIILPANEKNLKIDYFSDNN